METRPAMLCLVSAAVLISGCQSGTPQLPGSEPWHLEDTSSETADGISVLLLHDMEGLSGQSESEVEALADKSMVFSLGKREMPFTNQNFLLSFSLPNFYFHATTTYDILRMLGVPIGKMDFLGKMKVGT